MAQAGSKRNKPLVLHIDDSQTVTIVARSMLEDLGMEVINAASGLEGIQLAEKEMPGLILLDAMMPGLDGVETCRRLKGSPKTKMIPVLMITGASDAKETERIFAAGADGCLTKPIKENLLKAELEARIKFPTCEGQP
jgi:CheY-like chemotaxis protein